MLLILIHELGHFIAAKRSGVKVEEFGIGIPPKVIKLWTDKDGTDYTLNLIPL
ncbi:site-2 protease family protein [Patescibacteria group bacterium]|nr:site-2 protease family protein [Patescibacteria group bacterium]MBU1758412.1 site-2 protease family protein [Patescibacteria group bacterium]